MSNTTVKQKRAIEKLLSASEEMSNHFWKGVDIYKKPTMTTGVALSFPKLDRAINLVKKHFQISE
jgi:hypothetical protein